MLNFCLHSNLIIVILYDESTKRDDFSAPVLQNHVVRNSNVNEVTMHYKKFLIVREPMERLVSAFNDLFIVSDRKGLQREALKVRGARNRKITFNDFIKAVVLPQDSVGNFNSDM